MGASREKYPTGEAYIRFWGVRGSYATPYSSQLGVGGNTSCVEVQADSHLLVCDAGTGLIPLGKALESEGLPNKFLIIFSHYHWDHICGLPFFDPAFRSDCELLFFGPGGSRKAIEKRISQMMKAPYFPVEPAIWMAKVRFIEMPNNHFQFGPIGISYQNVHHPGVTFGYRIHVHGKLIVYAPDNEFTFLSRSIEQRYSEFEVEERALLEQMKSEARSRELGLLRGADILIHDAQYTPEDYESKRGWGHSCYVDTVNAAIDAEVKTLYLFHHDPTYSDKAIESIHNHALQIIHERDSPLRCEIAREGETVRLS
ncbi:MAG: MBL fold metallo-hydrolase [Gammaproteobacteria bacterium]